MRRLLKNISAEAAQNARGRRRRRANYTAIRVPRTSATDAAEMDCTPLRSKARCINGNI